MKAKKTIALLLAALFACSMLLVSCANQEPSEKPAAENAGSRRVLEKAGMRLVRTEKDGLDVAGKKFDRLFFEYSPKKCGGEDKCASPTRIP